MNITQIGIDLAKMLFQVHGVDARGKVLLRKQLKRQQNDGVFCATAAVLDRHGGLWGLALLGAQAHRAWAHGQVS
jgi:transposase